MNKSKRKLVKSLVKKANKGSLYLEDTDISKGAILKITTANWEFHLMEMILLINDIPTQKYLYANEYATIQDSFDFNKEFKELSCYNWSKFPSDINEEDFRGKFATLVLFWVLKNTRNICKKVWMNLDGKKNDIKRTALRNVILRTDLFIVNFLAGDTIYGNTLIGILDLTIIGNDINKISYIMDNFISQKKFLTETIPLDDNSNLPIIWDSILKLAYMMTTYNTNFKNLPKFDMELDYTNPLIIKECVGRLGLSILIHRSNTKRRNPVLYELYTKACPLYYTWFDEVNDHLELNLGIKAINYLLFLIDDERFTKFINDAV